MKHIVVDPSQSRPFPDRFKFCVGTGRLGLALQKEYLDHLDYVQQHIGFSYIRGHGLLHDDIGIYREWETASGRRPFYNFTYLDRIFDAYLERQIRPFMEIGFMPEALASGQEHVFYWKGNITPPKDRKKWQQLIKALFEHLLLRYGEQEVLKWPVEIWNEPNLKNFWKNADKEAYFRLYEWTVTAIKEVHPNIAVGGPAICGGSDEWIVEFLNFCARKNVPVDFVSRHAYTSKTPHQVTAEFYYQKLAPPEKMLREFETVRHLISRSPFGALPLHITEYNTSYSPINPVHDTAYNAAYLARILSEGGDYAHSFSYWTFSDVFEEKDIPRSLFHGGFGLVGLHCIPKPTFYLFSFFSRLGRTQLYRDEEVLITKKADGSLALVAWNPTLAGEGAEGKLLKLDIPVDRSPLFVRRRRVHENAGNALKIWEDLGRPRFPSRQAVEIIRESAVPDVTTEQMQPHNGRLALSLSLAANEVTLVEIVPVRDETADYDGLQDAF